MRRIYLFDKAPFNTISKARLIKTVVKWGGSHKKSKILNMNTYGVSTFFKNRKYANIINSADIIYPDGWGPVIASKTGNYPLESRVNVGDIIFELLKAIQKERLKIFLIGCEKKIVKETACVINKKYPKIKVCGYHSGFFNRAEKKRILSTLAKTRPNIVFVGMGIPNQEYFIYNNWEKLPDAVYMGVGGVFYYITNTKSRAPKWMRQSSLEWFYRLLQEPKRLGKRYTTDNLYFIKLLVNHVFKVNRHRNTP